MSAATAEAFDPDLLRALRAAPWRAIERRFLVILAVSIGLHIAFASYLAAQPMPVSTELSIDEMDRFLPQQTPPPLHPIPKIPNLPIAARPAPAPVAAHPEATAPKVDQARIARSGMLSVLGAKGPDGAFKELFDAPAIGMAEALKDARGLQVNTADAAAAKGAKTGQTQTVGEIGTEGVKKVSLGARVDSRPAPVSDGPIVVERTKDVDPKLLQQFVAARRAAVQGCYERALLHNPGLQGGKVVLRLAVGTGGRVSDLDIEEDTLGSEAVTSCMSTLVKRWVFPVAPKEELPLSVPFIFARSN